MESLPNELSSKIVEHLWKDDLLNLRLTCKWGNSQATHLAFRELRIPDEDVEDTKNVTNILRQKHLAVDVQEIFLPYNMIDFLAHSPIERVARVVWASPVLSGSDALWGSSASGCAFGVLGGGFFDVIFRSMHWNDWRCIGA